MGRPREPLEKRFWRHVAKAEGCWVWTGWKDKDGYGQMLDRASGKVLKAHRVAYEVQCGPIPPKMLVRHSCDVPACCNPAHLLIGTVQDNVADRITRQRTPRGEKHWHSKLTDAQRREVFSAPGTHEAIAKSFGVSRATVSLIKERKVSAHVNP